METIIKQEEATKLRVVVSREDSEVVNLTFPIYTLSVLDTIIPEKIVEKINLLANVFANGLIALIIQHAKYTDMSSVQLKT